MITPWKWTKKSTQAAMALAEGKTNAEAADEAGVSERTIYNWKLEPEFAEEVDRLSLMIDIAGRAERLRIARRVVRDKTRGATPDTARDLLDWLKFAQSETDGVKLDLAALAEALGNANDQ